MRFGDALIAIQTATLTDVKNDNPKTMSLMDDGGGVVVGIRTVADGPPMLVRRDVDYVPLAWHPSQAQMFSDKWELVK